MEQLKSYFSYVRQFTKSWIEFLDYIIFFKKLFFLYKKINVIISSFKNNF